MLRRSQPFVLALGVALALAGCNAHGPLPTSAMVTSVGKFHAKALHPKAVFSDRRLVVQMAPGAKPPIAGVQVIPTITTKQIHVLPKGMTVDQAMAAYQAAPGVQSFEPLELFPMEDAPPPPLKAPAPQLDANDPLYFQQYAHQNCEVPEAWQTTRGRPDVVVACLDTGVDYNHPDLQGQVIDGPDFGEGKDTSLDIDIHGTHVAGIIAAKADNHVGVAGIAPDCKVLAIKIFEPHYENNVYVDNRYDAYALARAIQYAVTQGGAKIINISAGIADDEMLDTMFQFARAHNVMMCVSAGNNGNNVYTGEPKTLDGVLVAHATTAANQLAAFSNYGSPLAVSAPGQAILSTVPTYPNPFNGEMPQRSGYDLLSGTSMASPMVAGVAALATSALMDAMEQRLANQYDVDTELKSSDVPVTVLEDVIRSSCIDLGRPGRDEVFGCGLVDAARAVKLATSDDYVTRAVHAYLQNANR